MVCSSSGVQPRSSSPWLKTSLDSLNRSFSCYCWSGERCSGTGGWCNGPGCEVAGGVLAMVMTSRTPMFCPECRRRGSCRWLCMAIQSSGPLDSPRMPATNAGRASSGQIINVLGGPQVVAADETGCFCWNLRSSEQQSTASGVRGSGWWSNRRRGGCWWSGGRSGWQRGFQGWNCRWNDSRQQVFHSLLLMLGCIQVYGLRIWLSRGSSPVSHIYSDA